MGAGSSGPVYIPTSPPPPRRQEDDYPVVDATGIGKGMAQGCAWNGKPCQLVVPQGVSSSGAKLYRDQGTIRRDLCRRYAADLQKVAQKQKAFEEVKKDLIAGVYYEDLDNGYCRQMVYDAADLKEVRGPEQLPVDKVRYATIRKMSDSGSYSSVTKLFIKPTIPFEIEFNGQPHKVSVLTLMHPSPIRVENIQHDAMLTLGDPGDGNTDGLVVLIPLQGAIVAGSSGDFVGKIARYMSSVLQPNPASGDYESIDIPTGSDWALSKLFTTTPVDGKSVVTQPGYYVWSGYPPLKLQPSGNPTPSTIKPWVGNWWLRQPGVQQYSWQPDPGTKPIQYIMLSQPALVSSLDLQTIRMLPVTPATEAVAPILKHTLSYRTAEGCPARTPSGTGPLTTMFSSREGMENQCDPFAPGSFPAQGNSDMFVKVIIGVFTTLAVGLAIYAAVYFFTKTKWGQWAANQGTLAGNYVSQAFVSDSRKLIPASKLFEVSEAKAEERLAAPKMVENPTVKAKKESEETKKAEADLFPSAESRLQAPASVTNPALETAAKDVKEAETKAKQAAAAGTGLTTDQAALDKYNDMAKEAFAKAEAAKKKAEEEAKKAEEEAETARKEKEAAEKAAKEAADAEAKARADAEAKAKADEEAKAKADAEAAEEIRKKAEEAARSASNTLKRRIETSDKNLLERAEAERKKQAEEYAAKQKEEAARAFRPTSGRATAAVPKAEGAPPRNPNEHAPPTADELQGADSTVAMLTTEAKAAAVRLPPAKKTDQSESEMKEKKDKLGKLRDDAFAMLAGTIQSTNLNRSLWKNRSVWMRFTEEQKHTKRLSPLVAKLVAFRTAIEDSGLDALQRAAFDGAYADLTNKTLRLLAESKRRLETLDDDAPPTLIRGGRRRKMKRKSTRRYVA